MATNFGGFMRFSYDGNFLRTRVKLEIEPTDTEYEGITNQDGSIDRSLKPMGYMFEMTFVDTPDSATPSTPTSYDWNAIMHGGPYNLTIIEDTTAVMHTFTGATFTGRAKVDRTKGEVTGIKGFAPKGGYQQTKTT